MHLSAMGFTKTVSLLLVKQQIPANLSRSFSQTLRLLAPEPSYQGSGSGSTAVPNVPGLSTNVVKNPSGKVGPGAAKDSEYKHPEYFCFDQISYYEAEIEMAQFRLPQPTNKA